MIFESIKYLESRFKENKDISFTYIKNDFCKSNKEKLEYNNLIKYFPGDIRHDESFLNLLSKLLYFFSRILSQKTEYIFNIYHLQHALYKDWIDFRSLRALYPRLLYFLNKIQFDDYQQ